MAFIGDFLCAAKFPVGALAPIIKQPVNLSYHTFDIDNRMAREHLWKAGCEITGQTFVWTLAQVKLKQQFIPVITFKLETDIKGAFVGIAKEGVKKLVSPFFWEEIPHNLSLEYFFDIFFHGHLRYDTTVL